DSDGDQLEDGVYTLRVTATDAEEEAIETSISSFGRATSVDLSSAEPTIQIGDMTAPLSDILAVAA
ncbi:MAG: hypothetical protein MI723_12590, partial [Caulobacterales bacterium]|nr:hypothetical protein [Caulobacterales bacterium]